MVMTDDQILNLRACAKSSRDWVTVGMCDNALRFGGVLGRRYRQMCLEVVTTCAHVSAPLDRQCIKCGSKL